MTDATAVLVGGSNTLTSLAYLYSGSGETHFVSSWIRFRYGKTTSNYGTDGLILTTNEHTEPGNDNFHNLGSSTKRWKYFYSSTINQHELLLGGASGQLTSLGSIGTSSQVLRIEGSSTNPSWQKLHQYAFMRKNFQASGYNITINTTWSVVPFDTSGNADTSRYSINMTTYDITVLKAGTYRIWYKCTLQGSDSGTWSTRCNVFVTPSGGSASELDVNLKDTTFCVNGAYNTNTLNNEGFYTLNTNDKINLQVQSDGNSTKEMSGAVFSNRMVTRLKE